MIRIGHIAAGTAILLLTLGIASGQDRAPSTTQPVPPQGGVMGPGSGMPMMGGPGHMGMMRMMGMADHVEGRIAFLKAELKITEAQMPQWNAFADVLRENARRMSGMRATMSGIFGQDSASVSAPDRLNRMEEMISIMLEAVKGTDGHGSDVTTQTQYLHADSTAEVRSVAIDRLPLA